MPRAQIEIDIPEGYELVRIASQYVEPYSDGPTEIAMKSKSVVIIRKAWQWPSWLKAAAVAMDKDGEWWAFDSQPSIVDDREWFVSWLSNDTCLTDNHSDFTPPPCTDWRHSLRLNPNREVKS